MNFNRIFFSRGVILRNLASLAKCQITGFRSASPLVNIAHNFHTRTVLGSVNSTELWLYRMNKNQQCMLSIRKCLPGLPHTNLHICRAYMRKKTIKIPPTKPLSFDYAGDLEKDLPALDPSSPKLGFEESEELKSADEAVQKVFSLEFSNQHDILQKQIEDITRLVQEHPADLRSLEVRIATLTIHIRNQIKHCLAFRKDKVSKVLLIERIQERTKRLKELKRMDHDKFEWLTQELKLQYNPVPEYNKKMSKRAARKDAAKAAMFAVKKQKMEFLRQQLEKEKEDFLKEKEQALMEIEEELKEFGVEMSEMDSIQSIFKALKLGEPYVKKREPYRTRREKILAMKFELYKNKYRQETEA